MPTPPNTTTQPAATVAPAAGPHHRTPAARPDDTLADDGIAAAPAGTVDDHDLGYVAFLFERAAQAAQQAVDAAVAAGVELPGWAAPAAWLYDYLSWTLGRQATRAANAHAARAAAHRASRGQARPTAQRAQARRGGGR